MPRPKRFLRLPEVESKCGLKRDAIYRGAREGWFPTPIKITDRSTGWLESEIDDFIEARVAATRSAPAPSTGEKAA